MSSLDLTHIRKELARVKSRLDKIRVNSKVRVSFNGEVWEGIVKDIRKHSIYYPDLRVMLPESGSKALYWVSGIQVVFND